MNVGKYRVFINEWNKVGRHQKDIFSSHVIKSHNAFSRGFIIYDDIIAITACHLCLLQEVLKVTPSLGHARLCPALCVPDQLPQLLLAYVPAKSSTTFFSSLIVSGSDSTMRFKAWVQNEKSRQDR